MIKDTVLNTVDRLFDVEDVSAHCDIPCKIYDPTPALIDALTVVRLMDIMYETQSSADEKDHEYLNTMARCVATKEAHAESCKHEIRVIWGDSLKAPQFEEYPQAHELTHKIMMLGSRCRQTVNREAGLELVEAVNQFAEIFWATKGVATKRVTCPYPPALEVVYPDL